MSVKINAAFICRKNISQGTQKRRLAASVLARDAKDFTLFNIKTDAAYRLKGFCINTF